MRFTISFLSIVSLIMALGCKSKSGASSDSGSSGNASLSDTVALQPVVVTDTVLDDSDDPAIWINSNDPAASFILGTDKDDANGGVYVFDLKGKKDSLRTVTGLKRVNNVDVAYGFKWNGSLIDIAVATERGTNAIRVFSLPDMKLIDGGGIPVFEGEAERDPMGIALYREPVSGNIYAIVSRKSGPAEGYLFQYLLKQDQAGKLRADLVRRFGKYSGKKEIESVAVDQLLGYVYYSDEQTGVRKYYAHPDSSGQELALFGQGEFGADNEGISFYNLTDSTGYILVSDQGRNRFNVYAREGEKANPHQHLLISSVPVAAMESDGSDTNSFALPGFPAGIFVAMSTDKTFHYYNWRSFAEKAGLKMPK